ncbi:ABC transporter permease [Loigolactobacillus jiayinensis]|uniref:ABC transporter permease n=1 Tax=Loigolactobacillus jiayinensis TaxID=2486016 RepID=A0ABW1REZ3_9LACO|nr:ABC transporter permease [Loigolactobacillus jiayinensis]
MKQLWQQRVQQHHKEMLKYSRYVFNEFFMIAIFIFIGALAYSYSNVLDTLTGQLWWAKPLILVILLVLLSFGHWATLLQDADTLFLLPKEPQLMSYLLAARRYSLWLPAAAFALGLGALLPFQAVATNLVPIDGLAIFVVMVALKDSQFWLQLLASYQRFQRWQVPFYLIAASVLALSLWLTPLAGVLAMVIIEIGLRWAIPRWLATAIFQWRAAVKNENSRMLQLYRLINLFTDVPQLSGKVHRRAYLDPLLRLFKGSQQRTFGYLYLREFFRGTEYLGLYLRLLVLGAVIIWFIPLWWVAAIAGAIFLYLVGFQLLPFYQVFNENLLAHLYPVPQVSRIRSFQHLVQGLLLVQALIFALVMLVNHSLVQWLLFTLVELAAVFLLTLVYFPRRLQPEK